MGYSHPESKLVDLGGFEKIVSKLNKPCFFMFPRKPPPLLEIALLSLALVTFSLWLQCNIGIDLADEGFLWYGAGQTASGEVPIRDFQSYDPGRYYWTAFWMMLFGRGIISLRISVAIFQLIGLTLGILALREVIRSRWMLPVAGFLLLVWMIPRHKLFESSLAMAAVYFAFCLIKKPSLKQHFISGVFVGVAAFFGRNHGLYSFLAFFILILFIWFKVNRGNLLSRVSLWLGGILLGYSPLFIMMLLVPGFFGSFVDSVTARLRLGYTNIHLPIPWPWRYDYSKMTLLQTATALSRGVFFLLLPLFYTFSAISILLSKRERIQPKALLIASTFVGIMYMHYSFSRADVGHLGQGIHPLLIGLVAVPFAFEFNRRKVFNIGLLLVLLIMSFFSAGTVSPYYQKTYATPEAFTEYNINGDNLWIRTGTAHFIDMVRHINSQRVPQDEGFLIAPFWPGLYPVLQRESPLWEIYFLLPQTEKKQKEMIEEMKTKKVNWVFFGDAALDGRDELHFRNTHQLLWQYFRDEFERVMAPLSQNFYLLHRKSNSEQAEH